MGNERPRPGRARREWRKVTALWRRIKPWLEAAEHSSFIFGPLVWTWLAPIVAAIIAVAWAWWNRAPGYVRYLAGLAAFVLVLAAVNFGLLIMERLRRRALIASLPVGAARRALAQTSSESIGPRHIIATCVVISIITSVFWYTLQTIHDQSLLIESTYLQPTPAALRPRSPAYLKVGIDVIFENAGAAYPLVGLIHQHRFEYPLTQLKKSDEDIVMREVLAGLDKPNPNGSEMPPKDKRWGTFEDDKLGNDQWQEFVDGKRLIYLFVGFTYYVRGTLKTTELCMWIYKNFPAHECHDHNKTVSE